MQGREKLGAYGAWAAVCFFWGTTYLAIRVGLESFEPTLFAGLRFVVAGGILFFVMSRQRGARLPIGREWFDLGVVGLALLGVGNGAVVGFGGLALLVGPQLFGGEVNGKYVLGVVIIQIGCVFWQAGSAYAKLRPAGVSPLMASAVQMLWAGVALTLLGTVLGEWRGMHFSARSAGALLYLVVFGSIVAYSA